MMASRHVLKGWFTGRAPADLATRRRLKGVSRSSALTRAIDASWAPRSAGRIACSAISPTWTTIERGPRRGTASYVRHHRAPLAWWVVIELAGSPRSNRSRRPLVRVARPTRGGGCEPQRSPADFGQPSASGAGSARSRGFNSGSGLGEPLRVGGVHCEAWPRYRDRVAAGTAT